GFLDEAAYWRLLWSADAVMDLTLMDNCLVCGAYEALAVGKPVILSDNEASKELFAGAAVFSGSTVAEIVAAVQMLAEAHAQMAASVNETARRLRFDWASKASVLLAQCRELTDSN
ncbi:MAG: glycosyltransferase family protein, partial [Mycobacteriales bacterium]